MVGNNTCKSFDPTPWELLIGQNKYSIIMEPIKNVVGKMESVNCFQSLIVIGWCYQHIVNHTYRVSQKNLTASLYGKWKFCIEEHIGKGHM